MFYATNKPINELHTSSKPAMTGASRSFTNAHICSLTNKSMLVLTRRAGETIMIGDEVTITVLEVKKNLIKVGVNAPKNVSVHREEIYQRIQAEKLLSQDD